MVNGTDTYYYRFNLQGDVTGIFDASGLLVAEYTYDAWGKLLSVSGSNQTLANLNPIRYRGYYYDTETGFYYLQSRYYDPEVCRFINADGYVSTGQGILGYNMYAYCLNNPVNFSDPSGLKCICLTRRVGPRHVCESVLATQEKEKSALEVVFTKEFVEEVGNQIKENVGFSAGICIGMGGEAKISGVNVEAMSRMDIVGVQYDNGELRSGHVGRSAFAIGTPFFSIGPQHNTYENYGITTREVSEPKYYDYGISFGVSAAFIIGGHIDGGISLRGIFEGIISYIDSNI